MNRLQRGVTLIELMTVIAILVILLTIAAPSLSDQLARRRVEGVANELSADLQFTKTQAVSVNLPVTLTTSGGGSKYVVASATTTYKTVTLDSSLSVTSPVTVTYDPLRATANVVTVTVSSSGTGAQLQLSTNLMGRVQVCSPSGTLKGYIAC